MPDDGAANLAVVIPTRDRWGILERNLDSLAKQSVKGFEIVVVADGKDQRPPELPGVNILVKDRAGPGAARNAGVRGTTRPLVLFLGDDMVPTSRLVERHLAVHAHNPSPEVAVLGHVAIHRSVHRNRLNRWMEWSGTQFEFHNIIGDEAGFGRFYSCNVSIKKSFFLEAGGFDESFAFYYEDLDLGWRLSEKGMRLLYEKEAVAYHLHPLSWDDVVRRFRGIAAGERLMSSKHDWFDPYFRRRVERARSRPRIAGIWPSLVELVPKRMRRLRSGIERRADIAYYQRLGPQFLKAWDNADDLQRNRRTSGHAG